MSTVGSLVLLLSGAFLCGIVSGHAGGTAAFIVTGYALMFRKRTRERLRDAIATRRLRRLER